MNTNHSRMNHHHFEMYMVMNIRECVMMIYGILDRFQARAGI